MLRKLGSPLAHARRRRDHGCESHKPGRPRSPRASQRVPQARPTEASRARKHVSPRH
ncbi:hypothetical protein DPMN_109154 [Dreissena polymorpha]|uniref:Uncharacterized protein n=1 Tax=Dreissena polymorpha TaxID=45954 RepID=A0A9D4K9S6_DREPO|nr:hypothetical protein DPMN_109154 [Dreissena polymorpha]